MLRTCPPKSWELPQEHSEERNLRQNNLSLECIPVRTHLELLPNLLYAWCNQNLVCLLTCSSFCLLVVFSLSKITLWKCLSGKCFWTKWWDTSFALLLLSDLWTNLKVNTMPLPPAPPDGLFYELWSDFQTLIRYMVIKGFYNTEGVGGSLIEPRVQGSHKKHHKASFVWTGFLNAKWL